MILHPVFTPDRIQFIRAFLAEHFPGQEIFDTFDFDRTAQSSGIGPSAARRHMLTVTKDVFDDLDFASYFNDGVADTLKLAGALRVTLTTSGPVY